MFDDFIVHRVVAALGISKNVTLLPARREEDIAFFTNNGWTVRSLPFNNPVYNAGGTHCVDLQQMTATTPTLLSADGAAWACLEMNAFPDDFNPRFIKINTNNSIIDGQALPLATQYDPQEVLSATVQGLKSRGYIVMGSTWYQDDPRYRNVIHPYEQLQGLNWGQGNLLALHRVDDMALLQQEHAFMASMHKYAFEPLVRRLNTNSRSQQYKEYIEIIEGAMMHLQTTKIEQKYEADDTPR